MQNGSLTATSNPHQNSFGMTAQQPNFPSRFPGPPPNLVPSRTSSGASSPSLPPRYPSRPLSTGQFNPPPSIPPTWNSQSASLPSSNRASPNPISRNDLVARPFGPLQGNVGMATFNPSLPPNSNHQTSSFPPQRGSQPSSNPPVFNPLAPPNLSLSNASNINTSSTPTSNPSSFPTNGPNSMFQRPPFPVTSNMAPTFPTTGLNPPQPGARPSNLPTSVVRPSFQSRPMPPMPEPPAPPSVTNVPSRLGPSGLKAKRPAPSYSFNPPAAPSQEAQPNGVGQPPQFDSYDQYQQNPPMAAPAPPPNVNSAQPYPKDLMADRMRKMSLSDVSCINLMEHRSIFPPKETISCVPPLPPDLISKNKYPEHFTCSVNVVPASSGILSKLKIPFGLVIQPFKNLEDELQPISPPIPRCKVCRTYINPYVQLNDGGRRWKCNICSRLNDMPPDYFYGEDGRRIPFDIGSRPELNSALVEYLAPSEYTTRPPQAAIYLYLLDVSVGAVQSGMVKMACKILAEELDNIPGDKRASLGIVCFDTKLYYFNLYKNSGQPQMLVVSDLSEPFIPTLDELIVNIDESKDKLKSLLSMIPTIFESNKCPDAAGGPVLSAAKELIFRTGGRISLLLSRPPSMGMGMYKKRGPTNKVENMCLSPQDDFYKNFALEATQKQVGIDMFLFPNDDIDMPTLSACSQFSAGSVFYYPQYHHEKSPLMAEKFLNEFRHYVTRPVAFEAVLRIRCTSGINIHSFFGHCFVRAHDLIALPNVSPDVAFGVQINIDDNLHENKLAIFQSALLYTSSFGDRRIRVHTLALPISNDPQTIYNNINIDCSVALLSKMAAERSHTASLGDARDALQYAVLDPLQKYRADYCPSAKGTGQLIVPNTQRLLPLMVSSLLKSKAFRLPQNVSTDERFYKMMQFKTLPIDEVLLMIYPRLYSLHNLSEIWTEKATLPPRLPLTAERLTRQGAFLLQTNEIIIVWVGRHAPELWINSVFNVATYNDLPEYRVGLAHYDNGTSDLIHDLLSLVGKIRDVVMPVVVVREDTRYGHIFLQYLREDKADGMGSYYEFLQKIQQQVG